MSLPTLMDLVRRSTDYLAKHGIENARRETEWIFAETLGMTRMELYTGFDTPLEEDIVARLRALIQRRGKREPLAYVLGTQDFMSLTLQVGPGVLVPRPETEEVVTFALSCVDENSDACVLDIGTGSGAIALAIKKVRPQWSVLATDISDDALRIAQVNGERLQLNVQWSQGHLATHIQTPCDLIVANLPYIGEAESADCDPELAFEPTQALYAGSDGLDLIRACLPDLKRLLRPHGHVVLEHGWKQGAAILALADEQGWACTIIKDGAGKDRFAHLQVPS